MTEPPIRVLLAKVGLDGHDRGVKVVARALRDAGMEVIYTGLWQTPTSIARAAEEEDVDIVGVSILSAAHMTLIPQIIQQLRSDDGLRFPLLVGGIIPQDDAEELLAMGAAAILGPETSLATIIETTQLLAAKHRTGCARTADLPWRTTLARSLTQVPPVPPDTPLPHKAHWIGITGPPGVGKSTLIGKLIAELRSRGKKVAVLAVDPSSPVTGGALLGDRARMHESEQDPDIFIRSAAARGQTGGLARDVPAMLAQIDRHGFDIVLIETVGTGQADYDICKIADTSALLLMPGAGDELQLEKAGVIEVADIIVLHKGDRPEADILLTQAREALGCQRPLLKVSALRNEGIEPLADAMLAPRR